MSRHSTCRASLSILERVCHRCVNHIRRALERLLGIRVDHVAVGSTALSCDPTQTAATQQTRRLPTQIHAVCPI